MKTFLAIVVLLLMCCSVYAEDWIVWDYNEPSPWGGGNPLEGAPDKFICSFDNDTISFDHEYSRTVGGSSRSEWTLQFTGTWGMCGTIDNLGNLIADPYATFIETNNHSGYINWASDTPEGYTAQLLIGCSFNGDGGAVHVIDERIGYIVSGTLILERFNGAGFWFYSHREHVFSSTYNTPEPTGIFCIILGLSSIVSMGLRKRRQQ